MPAPPKRTAFKKASSFAPKRAASTTSSARAAKRVKADSDNEDDGGAEGPVVPEVRTDEEGNVYVPINHSAKRRVTISAFKKQTFVGIREYYSADGVMKPGKKGISLTVEQYNALLRAAPLLERELAKAGEKVVRPDYDSVEDDDGVDGEAEKEVVKDEDAEDEEEE